MGRHFTFNIMGGVSTTFNLSLDTLIVGKGDTPDYDGYGIPSSPLRIRRSEVS